MKFDYLIVGAGLFGAVCAHELTDAGARVLVLERDGHVGGMCHTARRDGILCQEHGGHIYHTNDKRLWDYVQQFGEWRQYSHHVKASYRGTVYSFPPNRMTYQQLGTADPGVVRQTFYAGYTAKQWGRPIDEVPASVLARVPMRDSWNDEYFTDRYQGLPVAGYTALISAMLRGIKVELHADYLDRCAYWDNQAVCVIYTGPLDALLGYQFGKLEYRSLRYEWERHEVADYQGCPTMNYTDADVSYTRVHEHKHFYPAPGLAHTIVSREYPSADGPPYYPVNDAANQALYDDYRALAAATKPHVRLGGRLGSYRYLDMHQCVAAALHLVEQELD